MPRQKAKVKTAKPTFLLPFDFCSLPSAFLVYPQ